jgi:predicted transcriptional regulator
MSDAQYDDRFEQIRAAQRRDLDAHLAAMDQAAAQIAKACDECVDKILALLESQDWPEARKRAVREWLADNVRNPIDTIAEEKRRSIKTMRAMIEVVETFDPEPVRLPLDE